MCDGFMWTKSTFSKRKEKSEEKSKKKYVYVLYGSPRSIRREKKRTVETEGREDEPREGKVETDLNVLMPPIPSPKWTNYNDLA